VSGPQETSGLSFRLAGFPVHMPWSSLLGIVIISYFWIDFFRFDPQSDARAYLLTAVFGVLFYATILGHELAHAAVAQAAGFPVSGITLWWLGGFTSFRRTSRSPLRDGLIAAAGPVSSLAIGLVCAAVATATYDGDINVYVVAYALAWSNVFLAVYNALPGLPLDGGSVLRAIVWGVSGSERTGTVVAAWGGRVVSLLVVALPLWGAWRSGQAPDLIAVVFTVSIAVFLWQGASQALRTAAVDARVPRLSVRSLSRPAAVVAPDTPLAEALRQAQVAGATGIVTVDGQGSPTGIASPAAVDAVPVDRRPWVPVSSVCASFEPRAVLSADLVGEDVLSAMLAVPSELYLVVEQSGGALRVLASSDVETALTRD
jgi:Zn-dependent protease